MALITRRRSIGFRPRRLTGGSDLTRIRHCWSVTSLGYCVFVSIATAPSLECENSRGRSFFHGFRQFQNTFLKQYFELKLLFKGKKPQPNAKGLIAIDNVTVNNSGTINLLFNSTVNNAVGNAAAAIEADDTIESVEVLHGENKTPLVKIDRDELVYLKYDDEIPTETPKQRTRTLKKASLVVRSPDLLGGSMWAFNYKGHKIDASMQDAAFVLEVHNGNRSFTAGTELVADMTVDEDFDAASDAYVPKKYVITLVHSLKQQKFLTKAAKASKPKQSRKKKSPAKSPKNKSKLR